MSGYIPYQPNQSFSATQYFPSPQGNVYMLNNSLEVSNIPMGTGFSVAICPSENTMYIKTLQGGSPMLMVYSIKPFEQKEKTVPPKEQPDFATQLEQLQKQIQELKKEIRGGKMDELLK